MSLADHMPAAVTQMAEAALGVPVVGVCSVNRETIGPGGVPQDEIRRQDGAPTPLPHAFVLAVTATSIHVFGFKAFMGRGDGAEMQLIDPASNRLRFYERAAPA